MAQHASDTYPTYSLSERWADGAVHVISVVGSLLAAVVLVLTTQSGGAEYAALWLYGLIIVGSFVASAAYHMTPWEDIRPALRRIDHAAIFLKIAATYAPLVLLVGTGFSYLVLLIVWAIAIFGATKKLFFWSRPGVRSVWLYLGMGWLSVTLIWPMVQNLPTMSTWLVAIGGLTYSAGVIFYRWESLKFSNAIWHGFVLVASACFFVAIYIGQTTLT